MCKTILTQLVLTTTQGSKVAKAKYIDHVPSVNPWLSITCVKELYIREQTLAFCRKVRA